MKNFENILSVLFVIALVIFSVAKVDSRGLGSTAVIAWIFLFISAFVIAIVKINKVTKSANNVTRKVSHSLLISFLLFYSIPFSWFIFRPFDEANVLLGSFFVEAPSIFLFGITFGYGLLRSWLRRGRLEYAYNLRPFFVWGSVLLAFLVLVASFSSSMASVAVWSQNEEMCSLLHDNGSRFFRDSASGCMERIAYAKGERGDSKICQEFKTENEKRICYVRASIVSQDLRTCLDSFPGLDSPCLDAAGQLKNRMEEVLSDPGNKDVIYAISYLPRLNFYSDGQASAKYLPLLENIIRAGSYDAQKAALDILIERASRMPFAEEKIILREQILPLIKGKLEFKNYQEKIETRLTAELIRP